MKDILTKNVGMGKIAVTEPSIIMRPIELYLKEDGARDNTPSFAFVFGLGSIRVTPSVVGEISLKMLNEALNELGYKIEPAERTAKEIECPHCDMPITLMTTDKNIFMR